MKNLTLNELQEISGGSDAHTSGGQSMSTDHAREVLDAASSFLRGIWAGMNGN